MEPKGWIGVKGSRHGQLNMGKRWKKCHVLSKMSLLKHVDIVMLVESKSLGFQSKSSTGPALWSSRWKRRKRSCYDGWRQLSSRCKVAKTRSRSYEVYRCFPSLGATSRDSVACLLFFSIAVSWGSTHITHTAQGKMDPLKMYENVGFPASRASRFPARLDRTGYPGQLIHSSQRKVWPVPLL